MKKLWHDDIRQPPANWFWVRTNEEAKVALQLIEWDEISMDHDLGLDYIDPREFADNPHELWGMYGGSPRGDGRDLVRWMIETSNMPPKITIHSWNPSGAREMAALFADAGHQDVLVAAFNPQYSW